MPLNNQRVDEEIKKKIQNCLKEVKVETQQHTKPFGKNPKLHQEARLTETAPASDTEGKLG